MSSPRHSQGIVRLPFARRNSDLASTSGVFSKGENGLSWKTTRRFRRMLRSRALADNADALKNVDMTDLGGSMFLRLPGNTIGGETP
jgi:hypothetical protein